jgi:hypothetical protein
MIENKYSSGPVDCKCAAIIHRRGALFRFVFAVGSDAQLLWITLWLTLGATPPGLCAAGLPPDRLNFEQHFCQSNQWLARELVGVVRMLRAAGRQRPRLWTTARL